MSQNDDLISRQAAIDKAIMIPVARIVTEDKVLWRKAVFVEDIVTLPPAQPVDKDINVPDNDPISRQGVLRLLNAVPSEEFATKAMLTSGVKALPSVQPEDRCSECDAWNQYKNYPSAQSERKKGHWIPHGTIDRDGNQYYTCSECDCGETHNPLVIVNYCWNCGARMNVLEQTGTDKGGENHEG